MQTALAVNILECGPMPTPWKFLDRPPLLPSCKLGWLAGNQIRLTWFSAGVYNRRSLTSIIDTYSKPKGIWFPANLGLVLTYFTTWRLCWPVQKSSWGWHWSSFKNIGCTWFRGSWYELWYASILRQISTRVVPVSYGDMLVPAPTSILTLLLIFANTPWIRGLKGLYCKLISNNSGP